MHFFGTPPFLAAHETSGWFGLIRFTAFEALEAAAEVIFSLGERLLFLLEDLEEFGLPPLDEDACGGCFPDLPWSCCVRCSSVTGSKPVREVLIGQGGAI